MRHRPFEVLVVDVEISDSVERAARKPVRLPDGAPGFRVKSFHLLGGGSEALGAKRLAGDLLAVLESHHFDGSRVERHDAVPQDEREKADDHQYAQSERTAHDPDEGLASGLEIESSAKSRPAGRAFFRFDGLRRFGRGLIVVARVTLRSRHPCFFLFCSLLWFFRFHPVLTTAQLVCGSADEPIRRSY